MGPRWSAPGWALEAGSGPVSPGFSAPRSPLLFQRPSGRNPVMATLSGGRVSKATLATGYFPAPIRAKTTVPASEWSKFIPLLWGLVLSNSLALVVSCAYYVRIQQHPENFLNTPVRRL
ncbi:MAG: hypothetical protein HY774_00695 [Acidobacteria bacterium]|nr:hypothetical protein [Acidobacteriota bacterium]